MKFVDELDKQTHYERSLLTLSDFIYDNQHNALNSPNFKKIEAEIQKISPQFIDIISLKPRYIVHEKQALLGLPEAEKKQLCQLIEKYSEIDIVKQSIKNGLKRYIRNQRISTLVTFLKENPVSNPGPKADQSARIMEEITAQQLDRLLASLMEKNRIPEDSTALNNNFVALAKLSKKYFEPEKLNLSDTSDSESSSVRLR